MNRRRIVRVLIRIVLRIAIAMVIYAGWARWTALRQPTVSLVTEAVTRGDVVQTVSATGRLEAVTTVQVGSQVSGTIKALLVDFNSRVRQGQVIARVEPALFETQVEQARATLVRLQAEVERARAQHEDAQAKLTRAHQLAAAKLLAAIDLETAETAARSADATWQAARAQVAQAEASLRQSEINLDNTVITAPVDGVVISRNVDVGQTVAATLQAPTLFQIAGDLSHMRIAANIDESDVGHVRAGLPVKFIVDAYADETFTGTVAQVRLNPVVESNIVSYVAIVDVPNADLRLRPGMTANATVEVVRAADVLKVPASALRFSPPKESLVALSTQRGAPINMVRVVEAADDTSLGEKTPTAAMKTSHGAAGTVWVIDGDQLRAVPVHLGIDDGAQVAVLDGMLQTGDAVAVGVAEAPATRRSFPLLARLQRRLGSNRVEQGTAGRAAVQ